MMTNIEDLDLTKKYSYADYLTWQFQDRLELIRGYIYKMSPAPARKHQYYTSNLHGILWSYFKGKPCQVYSAPFDVRLPTTKTDADKVTYNVLQPDVCVVCDKSKLDDRGCVGAPDLVIEVLSPGNTKKEMRLKFDLYQEAGVREYWVVQPVYENVLVYVLDKESKLTAQPGLTNEDVLSSVIFPELQIDLNEVFVE